MIYDSPALLPKIKACWPRSTRCGASWPAYCALLGDGRAAFAPTLTSIRSWLGHNTDDYQVLAATGQGSWRPRPDAHLRVAFTIRAHHIQAQTVAQRVDEASEIWKELDDRRGEAHRHP